MRLHQLRQAGLERLLLLARARQHVAQRGHAQPLRHVAGARRALQVRIVGALALRRAQQHAHLRRRRVLVHRHAVGERVAKARPVLALLQQQAAQVQQRAFARHVVGAKGHIQRVRGEGRLPGHERLVAEPVEQVLQVAQQEQQRPPIRGRGVVLPHRHEHRPARDERIRRLRSKAAVLALALQYLAHARLHPRPQLFVSRQKRQRHQPLQITRGAQRGLAALQPCVALAHLRQRLRKAARQPLDLRLQLAQQPSLRPERAQRQRRKPSRHQRRAVEHRLCDHAYISHLIPTPRVGSYPQYTSYYTRIQPAGKG